MKIKKENKFKAWLYYQIYKLVRVRYGPIIIAIRGDWLFIDGYGVVWLLKYTHDPGYPIEISKLRD